MATSCIKKVPPYFTTRNKFLNYIQIYMTSIINYNISTPKLLKSICQKWCIPLRFNGKRTTTNLQFLAFWIDINSQYLCLASKKNLPKEKGSTPSNTYFKNSQWRGIFLVSILWKIHGINIKIVRPLYIGKALETDISAKDYEGYLSPEFTDSNFSWK